MNTAPETARPAPEAARLPYSFDGFGINGPDEHRTRLLTLSDAGKEAGIGQLVADLLNAEAAERYDFIENPSHD